MSTHSVCFVDINKFITFPLKRSNCNYDHNNTCKSSLCINNGRFSNLRYYNTHNLKLTEY